MRNDSYTYLLIKPWDMIPIYVGKGTINRVYQHKNMSDKDVHKNKHLQNTFKKAKRLNVEIIVEFVKRNISDEEAIALEIELIAKIGRKDKGKGPLANHTDGGDGPMGMIHSEETKRKMSETRLGENNGFYGKKHTEETRSKMRNRVVSEESILKMLKSRLRFKHTLESKRKISLSSKGRRRSQEAINKGRVSRQGYRHSDETKSKLKIARNMRITTEETKQKMRIAQALRREREKSTA